MNMNHKPILICCWQKQGLQFLSVSTQGKILIQESISVAELLRVLEQKQSGIQFKVEKQFTIQVFWNGNLILSEGHQDLILLIKGQNRVALNGFIGKSLIVNSRSMHCMKNVTVTHLLFQHRKIKYYSSSLDKNRKLSSDEELSTFYQSYAKNKAGKFKLIDNSTLRVMQLKIEDSKLVIGRKAKLMFYPQNNRSILQIKNSIIFLYSEGVIASKQGLTILAGSLINRGYIQCNNSSSIQVLVKLFENHGIIKSNFSIIRCKELRNTKKGKIINSQGTVIIQKSIHNQGTIKVNTIQTLNEERVSLENKGKIQGKKILINGSFIKNQNQIYGLQLSFKGQMQSESIFMNEGKIIVYQRLAIDDLLLQNQTKGQIISAGQVFMEIDAYLNDGTLNSNKNARVNSKGIIYNKGTMVFQSATNIIARNLFNQNKFIAKQSISIAVSDLFISRGDLFLENAEIFANSFIVQKDICLKGNNVIKADNLFIGKNLSVQNLHLEAIHLVLQNSGEINAQSLYIKTSQFVNRSKSFSVNNFSLKALSFKNEAIFVINQSGEIVLEEGITDSQNAVTIFNNAKIKCGPIIQTQGKVFLNNVIFEGLKDFRNSSQLYIQNADMKLNNFQHSLLTLNNAHITTNTYKGKQIQIGEGSNGIHQKQKGEHINFTSNQFVMSLKSQDFAENLKIYMNDCNHFKQIITSNANGYGFLEKPQVYGDFIRSLYCQKFDFPKNKYDQYEKQEDLKKKKKKQKKWKQLSKVNDIEVPKGQEKGLTINVEDNFKLRANLSYDGDFFSISSKNIHIVDSKVILREGGTLFLSADQTMKLSKAYIQAKGINLQAKNIQDIAGKYRAGLNGIFINAENIKCSPLIKKNIKCGGRDDTSWTKRWQTAQRTELISQGNIILKAQQLLTMISPHIKAKGNIEIDANNILIHGVFLLNEKKTQVYKQTLWGGQKTNTYYQRNDKPFEAKIQANKIILKGNEAHINAEIKGKQMYDLTQKGVHLFYIVGRRVKSQNRQFCNLATQGVEGHQIIRQKLLRADINGLQKIERPPELKGYMIFDGLSWDKEKTEVVGNFKQKVRKAKVWEKYWQQQTISPAAAMIVAIAASMAGAKFIAPLFINSTMSALQVAMIKTTFSTLTSKFAVSIAANGGNFSKGLQQFFSIDTVRALAFNLATTGVTSYLCDEFKIKSLDLKTKPQFINIFKSNVIKHAVGIPFSALIYGDFPKTLSQFIKPFIADVFGQYSASMVGYSYNVDKNIDYLTHKALHGIIGGVSGLILDGSIEGISAGALGAMISQITIQALVSKEMMHEQSECITKQMQEKGYVNWAQITQTFAVESAIAKIIGAAIGGSLTGKWEISKQTSINAIQNNFNVSFIIIVGSAILKKIGLAKISEAIDKGSEEVLSWINQLILKQLTQNQKQQYKNLTLVFNKIKQAIDFTKYPQLVELLNPRKFILSKGQKLDQLISFFKSPQLKQIMHKLSDFKFTPKKLIYLGVIFAAFIKSKTSQKVCQKISNGVQKVKNKAVVYNQIRQAVNNKKFEANYLDRKPKYEDVRNIRDFK